MRVCGIFFILFVLSINMAMVRQQCIRWCTLVFFMDKNSLYTGMCENVMFSYVRDVINPMSYLCMKTN